MEPDLNYQNPQVLAEAERVLGYWLKQGVDGFRLDAVPFIIDDPRKSAEHPDHSFYLLHDLAGYAKKINPQVVLLGEANIKPEEAKDYFAQHNEGLDMMINFEVNEYLFYAFATGKTDHLKQALQATAEKPGKDQWVQFLRNHDEIDLGKLSKHERKEVFARMAPDTNMQLYQRGIRRRLATMFNNNAQRLRQAYSLVFALPGTPAIRYGEEIGMGDDLGLKERISVRTPMQWDSTANAGFTKAPKPFRPLIKLGAYGYKTLNAAQQLTDNHSLLNYVKRMIALRKAHPEIGQGKWQLLNTNNAQCLMMKYQGSGSSLIIAYNFSAAPQVIDITEADVKSPVDLISKKQIAVKKDDGKAKLEIPAYGGYWLSQSE